MAWSLWDNFDKRFCGKWKSSVTINGNEHLIFLLIGFENERAGAAIRFNFNSSDFTNDVFYAEYSYDTLYFFHNDRTHRAEYLLSVESDDTLSCRFSVANCFGLTGTFEAELKFSTLSEDEERKYQSIVPMKDASRLDILREYAAYGDDTIDFSIEYRFDERDNILDIIETYNLDELVNGKSETDTAIALMHWFCERYKHGNIGLSNMRTPQELMKFADEHEGRTNCRGLALALAQIIRAYRIKAFHVTCMPYEEPFDDCHVIVSAWCDGRWIMLDPTSNLYLINSKGEIVGVEEFRDALILGSKLTESEGSFKLWSSFDEYRNYMAKNLIRLERGTTERFGCDEQDGHVVLVPEKYLKNEAAAFGEEIRKHYISSREAYWKM